MFLHDSIQERVPQLTLAVNIDLREVSGAYKCVNHLALKLYILFAICFPPLDNAP